VERAIVSFNLSVSRASIDAILAQEGGRLVGFLPVSNTAIVAFETEQVDELMNALGSLTSRSEVRAAAPAVFLPEISFDNDSLSSQQRASYDNILSSVASQYIIDNGLPLNPVNIAIIETGMDDSHGQNNEFANIDFYDLCTPEGQAGIPGTPVDVENSTSKSHGTKITGIVAGANNGNGNKGVIRGIPGSQVCVHVFRMNCGSGNDWPLIATAYDLILGGTLADFDIVNMSFGWIVRNLTTREEYRAIYESYFDSAAGQDILWVGGAGNDNQEIACNEFQPSGLACDLANVVSVGAYNADDLLRGVWTGSTGAVFGSNWGDGVTISAPGTDVWTATDPGTYGAVSGTSASTPLVSGAAAVVFAVSPMGPATMKALLVDEAQPLADGTLPEGGLDIMALLQASLPQVVYDNGASTHSGGSAVGHFIAADDFTLGAATRVTGVSVDVSDGPATENRRWDGTVEWWLFDDNAGLPGSLLASGVGNNIRHRDVVENTFGFRDFTVDFDFGEEVPLAAGQMYWLALHMQSDFSRLSVFWDHQGSTVGHASRSGGELDNGLPNFVDGEFAGPSAFDKAFRVWGRAGP
jgi:subtilisin family serine protease